MSDETAAARDVLAEACRPWEYGFGDPPDNYSPLHQVYSAGVTYAINMLAELTKASEWYMADGSETFEGDVRGTILNVLRASRLYDDETGTFAALAAPPAPVAPGERTCATCRHFCSAWEDRSDG